MRVSQSRILLSVSLLVLGATINCKADPFTYTTFQYPGTTITIALGINNQGQVVGLAAEVPGASVDPVGFIYDNGSFIPLLFGNSGTQATGINNLGIVVGTSGAGSFLYDSHTGIYSPFAGGGATGINDLGQIVGGNYFFDGSTFHTINYPGADSTSVSGLNNAGQIVGTYQLGGHSFGFLDNAGTFTSIAFPGASSTHVMDINNLGEIVGWYSDSTGGHGFIDSGGHFISFDVPRLLLDNNFTTANGLNDYGEIVGTTARGTGTQLFGFVATPTPEPGTLALAATGLLVVALIARPRLPRWQHVRL